MTLAITEDLPDHHCGYDKSAAKWAAIKINNNNNDNKNKKNKNKTAANMNGASNVFTRGLDKTKPQEQSSWYL
jgi:hypothetical protein